MEIGDTITVHVTGGRTGRSLDSKFQVSPGGKIDLPGRIIEDLGDRWVVELGVSIGGKNRIIVGKSSEGD
jgi:hypothetical protein